MLEATHKGRRFSIGSLLEEEFKTSLFIIGEVLNVPLVAVQAIAKEAGLEISDVQSACIGENALQVFADAYVRKLKSYFNSMKNKNNSQLGIDDYLVFDDFCRDFKKPECNLEKACKWSDIDTDAIREHFFALIEEKTPKKQSCTTLFDYIVAVTPRLDIDIESLALKLLSHNDTLEDSKTDIEKTERQRLTLKKITEKYYYISQVKENITEYKTCNVGLRIVLFAAHYHIFSRSGKSDPDNAFHNLHLCEIRLESINSISA